MREIRTSGSVRDGDGNVPIYSAMTPLGEFGDELIQGVEQRRFV